MARDDLSRLRRSRSAASRRNRSLRGQKRPAPLAKRSTCSKSKDHHAQSSFYMNPGFNPSKKSCYYYLLFHRAVFFMLLYWISVVVEKV